MEAVLMSDVLVVHEDVDEPAKLTTVVQKPPLDAGVLYGQALQDLLHRRALDLEGRLSTDLLAERARDPNPGHGHRTSVRASSLGAMVPVGRKASPKPSRVFRP